MITRIGIRQVPIYSIEVEMIELEYPVKVRRMSGKEWFKQQMVLRYGKHYLENEDED